VERLVDCDFGVLVRRGIDFAPADGFVAELGYWSGVAGPSRFLVAAGSTGVERLVDCDFGVGIGFWLVRRGTDFAPADGFVVWLSGDGRDAGVEAGDAGFGATGAILGASGVAR
jgi:hypothetical protein